ncbi:hypothetical protein TrRE_jg11776 [Triparma retinervis]|uniref:Uncharacterized protein n=1 Tax=Triparma retinervis TaxID=2557542 RepID=A0A9W7F6N3_9STRA|nr:hypothetical protein TrRE_jg11776 [Triparma retinervis]
MARKCPAPHPHALTAEVSEPRETSFSTTKGLPPYTAEWRMVVPSLDAQFRARLRAVWEPAAEAYVTPR